MKHTDILATAVDTLKQREGLYGPAVATFENVAKIASIVCVKDISPYDVTMIMTVMKLVRMRESRTEMDHYVDGVNYLAFAGMLAQLQSSRDIAFGDDIRELLARREETEVEPSAEEMAAKLAPESIAEPRKKNLLKTPETIVGIEPAQTHEPVQS